MVNGARDVGVSPAIVGSIPRKEAALVEVLFCFLQFTRQSFFLVELYFMLLASKTMPTKEFNLANLT